MWRFIPFIGLMLFSSYFSCQKEATPNPDLVQIELLSADATGINFENKVLEQVNRNLGFYDYFYNGGGCAVGDFNNDGKPDLFFTGNDTDNQLYINHRS